jgi:hypothetical protein
MGDQIGVRAGRHVLDEQARIEAIDALAGCTPGCANASSADGPRQRSPTNWWQALRPTAAHHRSRRAAAIGSHSLSASIAS